MKIRVPPLDTVETPPAFSRPRRYPRFELQAAVVLRHSGMMRHLVVRNVSRGGVLVAVTGSDLSAFTLGSTHGLTLLDPDGGGANAVGVMARVVRHDGGGLALSWDESDHAVAAVGDFLERFYSKR
jgi:hypothetical protein